LQLDLLAEQYIRDHHAEPSFKGYQSYQHSLCCAVNEQVVHGIPSENTVLMDGDILSIDFGVLYKGYYGDSAATFAVGKLDEETQRLVTATRESLERAIEKSVPGGRLSDVSHAVQAWVEPRGYSVVREFVGHGIGRKLHEAPQLPNYGEAGQGPPLKAGMTLAIEPMINAGVPGVKILEDGWTAVTQDGKRSAHFEHTVAITDNGPEILTRV
jgi:methionyl aminopeptidase